MLVRLLLSTLCAVAFWGTSVAQAQEWGTLRGRFVYDGDAPTPARLEVNKDVEVCGPHMLTDESLLVDENGGLANVVVYVRTKKVKVHPDYEAAAEEMLTMDNDKCRFTPHILPIRTSQTLLLHNSDSVGHNSNLQPLGDQGVNPLLAPMAMVEYKFNREQSVPVPVTCNIHPWMKGYILPRENPYVAVSAEDGTFVLENLPVGELEFQAWHERSGYLEALPDWKKGRFTLEIAGGDANDLGDVTCAPKLFEK